MESLMRELCGEVLDGAPPLRGEGRSGGIEREKEKEGETEKGRMTQRGVWWWEKKRW